MSKYAYEVGPYQVSSSDLDSDWECLNCFVGRHIDKDTLKSLAVLGTAVVLLKVEENLLYYQILFQSFY